MKTLNRVVNKKAKDPIDKLIFEKGLRVKHILLDKALDLFLVILNNGNVLQLNLSSFPKLKVASEKQLNKWKLVGNGTGLEWEELDEDLSLKGFISSAVLDAGLKNLGSRKIKTSV